MSPAIYIPASAATYTGPGDVVPGALAWWGLRAYSASAIGSNAVRIVRASDSTQQNFITLTSGALDVASITAFLASTTGKVVTVFDQTGNGLDLTQATDANRPAFTLNAFGSLPGMSFVINGSQRLFKVTSVNQAQPYSSSFVARRTGTDFTSGFVVMSNSEGLIFAGYLNDATSMMMSAGNFVTSGTTTNNSLNAVHNIYNGASSKFIANGGAASTVDAGLNNLTSSNNFSLGNETGASTPGDICEGGWWPGAFSAGNISGLATNEKTYWGIP